MVKKEGYETLIRAIAVGEGEMRHEIVELEKKRGNASVIVRSQPEGLSVFVDGSDTGRVTPATVSELTAGDHQVMLKRGETIVTQMRVTLSDGSAEVIDLDTSKLPAILNVESDPSGARVAVDGEDKGTTPTTVVLSPGSAKLVVTKDGCESFETRLKVERATVVPITAKLECGTN
jgi:hypothetical protein